MRCMLVVLAAAGCGFTPGMFTPTTGDARVDTVVADDDAPRDAPADVAPDAVPPYCGTFVELCPSTLPDTALVLTSMTIDTGSSGMCDASVTSACVVAATSISLPSGVTVTGVGTRPLVLFAWPDGITIEGTLSVASRRTTTIGAGSALGPCNAPVAPSGNGGGAGGSFGALGGSGGDGTMGSPGTPGAVNALTTLRGGCPGSNGAGTNSGLGRPGGGVVDLIASSILVDGTINASGMGGDAATQTNNGSGGGGGGSGGAIVFDTPSLTINATARVFANGGGGGEAASSSVDGDDGNDPTTTSAAAGGGNFTNSGDGGDGSDGGVGGNGEAEDCTASTCGGGGGGGGAGVIKTTDPMPPTPSMTTMSPGFT